MPQQRLADQLELTYGWELDKPGAQDGSYHSGGGFSYSLPMVAVRRAGPELLRRFHEALAASSADFINWYGHQLSSWGIRPSEFRIDVYDLGMAVLRVTLQVEDVQGADLTVVAQRLKECVWLRPDVETGRLTPFAEAIQAVCRETTKQFSQAVSDVVEELRLPSWMPTTLDSNISAARLNQTHGEIGRLLWLHPVHMARVDNAAERAAVASALAPAFHRRIVMPGGLFVPGIGWSAVVLAADSDTDQIALRLLEMQWAYIALYMEIDRGLLVALDDKRWSRDSSLSDLEDDADRVFSDFIRVMEARTRADTALADLGGDEQAIWDAMNEVTRLDALVAGVDRKVDVLQRVAERRVQQATAASARRTTAILSFLTALTVVTVALAVVANFIGSRSDAVGHLDVRVLTVALALITAIVLYQEAFRDRPKRRRRRAPRAKWRSSRKG